MAKSRHISSEGGQQSGPSQRPGPPALPEDSIFDETGVPVNHPVGGWLDLRGSGRTGGPGEADRLRAVLRFTRPDGSPVFGPRGRSPGRLRALEAWSIAVADPALATVIGWWLPRASHGLSSPPAPPPLPSDGRPDRPLAVLRPDWTPRGDLLAIDHREPGLRSLVEVSAKGQTWVGPTWDSPGPEGKAGRPVPTHWSTGAFADGFEWSFRVGRGRSTRVAVLLRGRGLALLGQQDEGTGPTSAIRLALPDGIEATPAPGSRSLILSAGRGKPSVRLIPLGLPTHDYPTDRGSIAVEGREVVVRQAGEGRIRWVPLLLAWEKLPTLWRPLTVASKSRACRPDVASAVRVAWGPGTEGLVIYRSLAPPALRNFLGHQTAARFLVGAFTKAGELRPILKLDG
jgi:hypothetical protein